MKAPPGREKGQDSPLLPVLGAFLAQNLHPMISNCCHAFKLSRYTEAYANDSTFAPFPAYFLPVHSAHHHPKGRVHGFLCENRVRILTFETFSKLLVGLDRPKFFQLSTAVDNQVR